MCLFYYHTVHKQCFQLYGRTNMNSTYKMNCDINDTLRNVPYELSNHKTTCFLFKVCEDYVLTFAAHFIRTYWRIPDKRSAV